MPPKHLRSSVAAAANQQGLQKNISQLTERISLLEKRYSKVMIHQTYFKILDEWLQCMFGVVLFPDPKEMEKSDEASMDEDTDNPFYEVHMLHQRMNLLEEELHSMGIDIPRLVPKRTGPGPGRPPAKRSYGSSGTVIRRRSMIASVQKVPPRPPVLKPQPATPAATVNKDIKKEKAEKEDDGQDQELEKEKEGEKEDQGNASESKSDDEKDKPPVLEEIKVEPDDEDDPEVPPPDSSPPESGEKMDVEEEQVEEEDEDDDFDNADLDDLEYAVGRYAEKKIRETVGTRRRGANNGEAEQAEEQIVQYTTRGRRHTLPRRYAEFTGHDNVASILKSQQRSSGSGRGRKPMTEKPKTPKPKPPPKLSTPKKQDGSRPECVYKLIADVQAKEVDADGNVTLWDELPNVKVNQQQLISVIFRSNGMATRLTRKLTTLVFEDQVLANTSPFGTKYYQERLPPEPLEAMVEFISGSGFDPDHTKKKIYMVVGQVCNEARAGRVRKLMPSGGAAGSATNPASDTNSTNLSAETEIMGLPEGDVDKMETEDPPDVEDDNDTAS